MAELDEYYLEAECNLLTQDKLATQEKKYDKLETVKT